MTGASSCGQKQTALVSNAYTKQKALRSSKPAKGVLTKLVHNAFGESLFQAFVKVRKKPEQLGKLFDIRVCPNYFLT